MKTVQIDRRVFEWALDRAIAMRRRVRGESPAAKAARLAYSRTLDPKKGIVGFALAPERMSPRQLQHAVERRVGEIMERDRVIYPEAFGKLKTEHPDLFEQYARRGRGG